MRHSKTFLAICLIGLQGGLMAQINSERSGFNDGVQLTGQVQLALPQNEFAQAFNGYPAGFGASLLIPLGKTGVLRFGPEYAWNSMGSEKTAVELFDDAQNVYQGDMNIGTDVRSYHIIARLSPFRGGFRPYFDAFLGWKTFSTDSEVVVEENDGTITTTSYSLSRDASMSYGYAGGLMIALGRSIFIDGKVQVVRGGNVTYIDQSTLIIDGDGDINYSLETSPTDVIIPQIGLSIVF